MNKLTLKEQQFIKITAKTLNPTQAVRETYQLGKNGGSKTKEQKSNTASIIASENLRKPHIIKGLREEMEEQGVNNKLITSITKRNLEQNKNLPASNQIIDMYNKIKGNYTPEVKVNVNVNPANIDKLIEAKINEYKQLQAEDRVIE